jgi:hypothetical protein
MILMDDLPGNPKARICFYCGGEIEPLHILWFGKGSAVALHPSCAVELIIRLCRDVYDYEESAKKNAGFTPRKSGLRKEP